MTFEEVLAIVSVISYKPGWRFDVQLRAGSAATVRVAFDPTTPYETYIFEPGKLLYGRPWIVSTHATRSEVVQTALLAVLAAEEHEAREAFRYKGMGIFGPHFDVEKLVGLCEEFDSLDVR